MTSQNHSAFLMCPASAARALGGTPPQQDVAGGHIKKADSFVHVYDALPAWLKSAGSITGSGVLTSSARAQEPSSLNACGARLHISVMVIWSDISGGLLVCAGCEFLGRRAKQAVEGLPALLVAGAANGSDFQRLGVVAVIVVTRLLPAVNAELFAGRLNLAALDSLADGGDCTGTLGPVIGDAGQADKAARLAAPLGTGITPTASDGYASHNSSLLLCKTQEHVRPNDLEIHQPRLWYFSWDAGFWVEAKPLGNCLRCDLAQAGHLTRSTKSGNNFFVIHGIN